MSNFRRPFRLNVGFVAHADVGYIHDFTFDFQTIRIGEDLELSAFNGIVNVGRTPQGLLFTGHFRGGTILECVRCLKPFEQELRWTLSELYAFTPKSVSDSGLILPEDAQVDIEPLIREYALLEIPINPICRFDCLGLCPICGEDLNVRDCGHRPGRGASPFAALRDFLSE
jgi:uncharacterized protein